jgi:hypothetical protein
MSQSALLYARAPISIPCLSAGIETVASQQPPDLAVCTGRFWPLIPSKHEHGLRSLRFQNAGTRTPCAEEHGTSESLSGLSWLPIFRIGPL